MREIVHIQAGQCGNQIGAKVQNILYNFKKNISRNSLSKSMANYFKPFNAVFKSAVEADNRYL